MDAPAAGEWSPGEAHGIGRRTVPPPQRHRLAVYDRTSAGTARHYADGVFPTHSDVCETYGHDRLTGGPFDPAEHEAVGAAGRAMLRSARTCHPGEQSDADYPLLCTSGRTTFQFHTRTKTGWARPLDDAAPHGWIELNPDDAATAGIEDGDLVRVESPRGAIELPAYLVTVRRGVVFAPFLYGHRPNDCAGGTSQQVNELTPTSLDPVAEQPAFKTGACRVSKVNEHINTTN